jgi:hypothetical protein
MNEFLYNALKNYYYEHGYEFPKENLDQLAKVMYGRLLLIVENLGYHEIKDKSLRNAGIVNTLRKRVPTLTHTEAIMITKDIIRDLYLDEEK